MGKNHVAKWQSELMVKKGKELKEAANENDIFDFKAQLVTLESQLQSMKTKGFLRSYKSYNPPADLDSKFLRCVSEILEQKLSDISSVQNMEITSLDLKLKLINGLHKEFSHKIYNYYKHPVSTSTPYQQLHDDMLDGNLPDNLVVQLDAIRFTGEGDHPMDKVTAFPRRNTIYTSINARDQIVAKKKPSPYQEEDYN